MTASPPLSYAAQAMAELNSAGHSSLISMFEQIVAERPDEVAFSCLGHETSYAEMERLTANLAAWLLHEAGLQAGDRIAIQLPNIIQYPIAVWAAFRAGLIVVNTNPQYTAREQIHQFNDSGAVALVVLEDLLPLTDAVLPQTGIKTVVVTGVMDMVDADGLAGRLTQDYVAFNSALVDGAQHAFANADLTMADLAVLQYTGGTTGPSKGAMLSHGNLFSGFTMSRLSIKVSEPGDPEIPIVPLPLYHVFGFTSCVIGTFLHGGTSVLIPDPRKLDTIIQAMKDYPFTYMASVNTLLQGLMAHPEFDNVDFSHLRIVIAGGTALVKEIGDEWEQRTGVGVYEGYGLSETSSTATCNRVGEQELGTVGPPMEYVQVKLIDSEGQDVVDGAGEICIRGPNVMQGYWQRPEATAEAIDRDGWFRTGDIGVIQADGKVKIVDRIKDMILVSGFNVYPNEIEAVVYGMPDIVECAAIGIPNEATGEAIKMYVVSKNPDLTADDIIEFCRAELTGYKIPKVIVFADDLPKSPAGKILRRELRELDD